jgi:AcrR family transcriptional regulator
MARKSGKNEEARERSRAALLQAGADLMLEDALRQPFAALRLRRLCEKAGLSTGAFYVHWVSLDEFYDDLANQLTEQDQLVFAPDFQSLAETAEAPPREEAFQSIMRVADQDLRLLLSNPLWDAMELVSLTWGRTSFRNQLADGYHTIDKRTGHVYGSILSGAGREPRDPLDWDSIGTILQGLAEGLGLRSKIDPAAVPASSESAAGLYATAVGALLAVLTRPSGESADASGEIRALLA